jgi:GntR family transcriptional regulator
MLLAKKTASPMPLYFKVMMEIRENILSGKWSSGSQIPGELGLAHRLGVSVITIRQALGQLAQQGYVRRERARGTFVNWKGPLRQSVSLEVPADDLVTVNPHGTSFKLLAMDLVDPPHEIRRDLKMEAGEKVTRISRMRLSHGQPLAYVTSYTPLEIGRKIRAKDLARVPLNTIIENLLPCEIAAVKHTVAARLADDEVADQLGIPAGSPVLYVERDYLHNKTMVLRTLGYYRSDLFSYELTLKRRRG